MLPYLSCAERLFDREVIGRGSTLSAYCNIEFDREYRIVGTASGRSYGNFQGWALFDETLTEEKCIFFNTIDKTDDGSERKIGLRPEPAQSSNAWVFDLLFTSWVGS